MGKRLTNAELNALLLASQRENEALRAEASVLRAEIELRDRRIAAAIEAYRALRDEKAGAQPRRAAPEVGEVVSTYTRRDGGAWAKVRVGHNTYAHRPLEEVGAHALAE